MMKNYKMKKYKIIKIKQKNKLKDNTTPYTNIRNTESVVTCIYHGYELWNHNS